MVVLAVPYHLDERLGFFDVGVLAEGQITAELGSGTAWQRMAVLYEQVADAIAGQSAPPLVLSGDCTTSLAVLAGLQRAGHDLGVVWFDAHADFHTEATTTSGYLGGMPLALAAGVGTPTLPDLLGLRPVPESQILLVDARDTDPGEHALLDASAVQRSPFWDCGLTTCPRVTCTCTSTSMSSTRGMSRVCSTRSRAAPPCKPCSTPSPSSWLPDASLPSALPRPGTTRDKKQPLTRSFCGTSSR